MNADEKNSEAPTTGSGQLTVAGRYKAYGQDLTIKDGVVLEAGTVQQVLDAPVHPYTRSLVAAAS